MVSNARVGIGVSALIGLTLSVLLMLMASAPAQAETTVADCQQQITNLKSLTDNVDFLGKKAADTKANLFSKLDEANAKLVDSKYEDAIQKLTDFKNTVIALGAGKINPDDASNLITEADRAIVCVSALQEQTPTATE
jgi:hypothetical protein